jgi:hypothetical protein
MNGEEVKCRLNYFKNGKVKCILNWSMNAEEVKCNLNNFKNGKAKSSKN